MAKLGIEGIIIGVGMPFEEKVTVRADLRNRIRNLKGEKEIKKEVENMIKAMLIQSKEKSSKFEWCETEGIPEPYCMANSCYLCPANKFGLYYNPDSKLVRMYKEGKIKSYFDTIETQIAQLKNSLGAMR
jgi:hypothetical protein